MPTNESEAPRIWIKHGGGEPELLPSERRDLGGAITNALEMPDSIWVSPPLDEKGTRSWGGYHMRKDDARLTRVSQPGEGARIDPVNTYPTVIEAVQLLEAAGFGVAGNPNALLAMVKEAIAAAQPSFTPADEEVARARAVLAAVEIERLWQPQHTVDDCGACREYRKTIIAMIQKHCFTTTDVEQGTCTWTCEPNPDIEMWETDCDNAFQFEVGGPTENKMKFCCYCGKPLVEATKENSDGA